MKNYLVKSIDWMYVFTEDSRLPSFTKVSFRYIATDISSMYPTKIKVSSLYGRFGNNK